MSPLLAGLLLAVSVTAQGKIVEVMESTPDLSTFVEVLEGQAYDGGELVSYLSGFYFGPYTVFAPSNAAFDKLPASVLTSLLEPSNASELTDLLNYHVAYGFFQLQDLNSLCKLDGGPVGAHDVPVRRASISTRLGVPGSSLNLHVSNNGGLFVNSAQVIQGDIAASNGVIHLIDSVLMTPARLKSIGDTIHDRAELSTFVSACKLAGVRIGFNPYDAHAPQSDTTVFAPTNKAFDSLLLSYPDLVDQSNRRFLRQILNYHIVKESHLFSKDITDNQKFTTAYRHIATAHFAPYLESGFKINNAVVITKDIAAYDGVLHVVDSVLIMPDFPPPGNYTFPFACNPTVPPAPLAPVKSLASTIHDRAELSTFETACKLAGVRIGFNPYDPATRPTTVFAPTKKAFASLLSSYPGLLDIPNRLLLAQVLKYHIVNGASVFSKDITDNQEITTAYGQIATAHVAPYVVSGLKINTAVVITKDIAATDGVLHVVDSVLVPPNFASPIKMHAI